MTEQKTNATDWRVGDRVIIYNNNLKINHLYIISELEDNNQCTVLTLSQRIQLGFSGQISEIKPSQKTILCNGFDRNKKDPEDVYNIDATLRAKDAEIAALKVQVPAPWCYDLDEAPEAWMPIPQAPKGETK